MIPGERIKIALDYKTTDRITIGFYPTTTLQKIK
jgi:hypothetical protein